MLFTPPVKTEMEKKQEKLTNLEKRRKQRTLKQKIKLFERLRKIKQSIFLVGFKNKIKK